MYSEAQTRLLESGVLVDALNAVGYFGTAATDAAEVGTVDEPGAASQLSRGQGAVGPGGNAGASSASGPSSSRVETAALVSPNRDEQLPPAVTACVPKHRLLRREEVYEGTYAQFRHDVYTSVGGNVASNQSAAQQPGGSESAVGVAAAGTAPSGSGGSAAPTTPARPSRDTSARVDRDDQAPVLTNVLLISEGTAPSPVTPSGHELRLLGGDQMFQGLGLAGSPTSGFSGGEDLICGWPLSVFPCVIV